MSDVVDVRHSLEQIAVLLEVPRDQRARLVAVQAGVESGLGRQRAVPIDDADRLQVVTFADLEVELVVAWGDLERAGAELEVDGRIGNERNQAVEAA